jgi:NAD(P)H-flavin reductase
MKDYEGRNLIIVAGGIGLIPLRSIIIYALHHRPKYGKIQVFYGARTPKDLLYTENLKQWQADKGFECYLTVDKAEEGWKNAVGVVGGLFKMPGVEMPVDNTTVFVCGPPIMFRFVLADLQKMGFQDQNMVSTLERYMKCGVGKCGHCCIGVAYVCTDGPVFTLEQIRKLGEVI